MNASPFCDRCSVPHPPAGDCPGDATFPSFSDVDRSRVDGVRADPFIGQQVGNFRIERLLGAGGMGAVYLGRHPAIGSRVAIKFLRPEFAADPDLVRRLFAEARAANLAEHDGILRVLDVGQHPLHGFFLVMEYLEGETLSARTQRGALPLELAQQILMQLSSAIGAAHAKGIVHRDLKPDNVMVLERPHGLDVKVMDFGIAKLREAGTASRTAAGAIVGTPGYIAPEQCDGRSVDARTDIYALGVMAFELATGRLPFNGTPTRQMLAHLTQLPPRPSTLRPDLPAHWEATILRALSKRPEDRFASMEEFSRALSGVDARPAPLRAHTEVRRLVRVPVEVALAPGRPPVRLVAVDLSRGGALLAYDGEPPDLFSRVTVKLGNPPVEVPAEVVRQVTEVEARAWGAERGFAIQFCGQTRELTERIAELVSGKPAVEAPEPPPGGALTPQQRLLLARYAAQASASHYELLGLALDAPRADIVAAGQRAVAELRELEARPLIPAHADQVRACLQRVATAIAVLSSVRERLQYDARRGNSAGIGRAIAAGCSESLLREERGRFLRERPEVEPRLAQLLARVRLAVQQGQLEAAHRELREALRLDPLNVDLHRRLEAWRGER